MIHRLFYSPTYDWTVECFFAVHCYYADDILDALRRIDCPKRQLRVASRNLRSCNLDTGITFSNPRRRCSVLVTSLTSSAAEFMDSYVHETGHLATHIALADHTPLASEALQYLHGDICRDLFPSVHTLLCDCCRRQG